MSNKDESIRIDAVECLEDQLSWLQELQSSGLYDGDPIKLSALIVDVSKALIRVSESQNSSAEDSYENLGDILGL